MLKEEIKKLQQEKDVVILAHYYVDGDVQEVADYVILIILVKLLLR